jgi:ribose 5-phosphate isomerase B
MKIAIGSDERAHLTDAVIEEARRRGHEVLLMGALAEGEQETDWPLTSQQVAEAVAAGVVGEGIVCCWTGTGASIAANKVAGVRAALCGDAETARGARVWNAANVLALSLRATSEPVAREIMEAWFSTAPADDEWNRQQVERVGALDERYRGAPAPE